MKARSWKTKIRKAMLEVGTYQPAFDPIVDTLADILAKRDEAQELYKKSGGVPVVTHTNKAGAKNVEQNPVLRLINDLNRDALQYWRDLGLTPAGLKKINDEAMKPITSSPLDQILSNLEI